MVPDSNNVERFYIYTCLPFGVSSAVNVVDKLLRPHKIYCHRYNIDISVYIDDGISVGSSELLCIAYFKFTLFLLAFSGWSIQTTKCSTIPKTEITYLGYTLNSNTMQISVPVIKVQRLILLIDTILTKNTLDKKVSCKLISSLCGLMAHMIPSHAGFIQIVSRQSQHALGVQVTKGGWNSSLTLNENVIEELKLCQKYAHQFNGAKLKRDLLEINVLQPYNVRYLVDNVSDKATTSNMDVFFSGINILLTSFV